MYVYNLLAGLVAFGGLISQAASLGINCRGSGTCGKSSRTHTAVKQIFGFMEDIQPCRVYHNGDHIACINDPNVAAADGGFCAFLQNAKHGYNGQDLLSMIDSLQNRTDDVCGNCGSVPVTFPPALGNSNDPGQGILTVNFVSITANSCPDGLCP